jgi:hypothetical protein
MVRRGAVGLGAALAVGLVLGAVARLMMRLVTLAAGHTPEFSLGGTLGIMIAFALFMAPGALLAALWRGRGRWLLLAGATVLLLVVASGVAITDVGDVAGLSTGRWVLLVAAAVGVFVAILAMPLAIYRLVGRAVPARPAAPATA